MLPRQPPPAKRKPKHVPGCWLMGDARLGDALPSIIAGLPPRSAVVVRPYAMHSVGQAALIRAIRRVARAKRHLLLLAGGGSDTGFDGRHGQYGLFRRSSHKFLSLPVHNQRELARAQRLHADAMLISPIFATRSHPGSRTLGIGGFARLAAPVAGKAVALGGMEAKLFGRLRGKGAVGWAAIDAWLPDHRRR